jgi:ankyrin repeat protein
MDEFGRPTLFRPGVGKRGMTELHYAAYCGDLPELLRCLAAGQDANATDTYRGYTAAHWLADMAATGGPRVEMLRALVRYGADISARTPDGATPLMLARAAGSDLGDELAVELIGLGAEEG